MWKVALVVALLAGCRPASTPKSTGPVVLADHRSQARNLAIDPDGLYWTEASETDTSIVEIATPITPREPAVVARVPGTIEELVVDRDAFYVVTMDLDRGPAILRIDKRGGRTTTIADNAGRAQIAIDRTDVYWIDGGGKVMRMPKAGGAPTTLADNVEYSYADALAVGDRDVVFSNALDDTPRRIYRVAKTGGEVARVDDAAGVTAWTLIAGHIYYGDGKVVWKVALGEPASSRVRAGTEPFAVVGGAEQFFAGDDPALRPLHALGDNVGPVLYAHGALWYVRDGTQIGTTALR